MRSRLRSRVFRSRKTAFACVGVLLFIISSLPGSGALAPSGADATLGSTAPSSLASAALAASPRGDPAADGPALADLVLEAHARVADVGGSASVSPDGLPGYDALDEQAQRALWRAWVFEAVAARAASPAFGDHARVPVSAAPVHGSVGSDVAGVAPGRQADTSTEDLSDLTERSPYGLKPVWSLEVHGRPREVVPVGEDGAHLLVTERSVLRFEGPGVQPSWMLKPGVIRFAEAHDVNDDDVPDMLVLVFPFTPAEDAPTVYVFDGADGTVLQAGFAGDDSFDQLTTGDVDGDGVVDLVGVTVDGRLIAAKLDGTRITEVALPSGVPFSAPLPFLTLASYYTPQYAVALADVDGDGAKDFIVTDRTRVLFEALFESAAARSETLRAYSSADGEMLWERHFVPEKEPGWAWMWNWPIGAGDLDGDGLEDVAFGVFENEFHDFFQRQRTGFEVFSGADGSVLMAGGDDYVCMFTCLNSVAASTRGEVDGEPIMILDLDGDGRQELLLAQEDDGPASGEGEPARNAAGAAEEPARQRLVLRGVVPGPDGEYSAPEERYRTSLELPELAAGGESFHVRDIDADGVPEMLLYLTGLTETREGEPGPLVNELIIIRATGSEVVPLAQSFAFWDYDPVHDQAYGLTWDDRWVPVDADGRRIGTGTRLLSNFDVRHQLDQNADGIDDLLIRLGSAVAWVDGSTGALFRVNERPLGTYVTDVVKENGRLRLFEHSNAADTRSLVDLDSGTVLWTVDVRALREEVGRDGYVYVAGLTDYEGDGRFEPVVHIRDWNTDSRTIRVLHGPSGEIRWEMVLEGEMIRHEVTFFDALPGHPGHEILIEGRTDGNKGISLGAFTRTEPFWSLDLGESGRVHSRAAGHLLILREQTGLVVERVGLLDGVVSHSYPLPKDAGLEQAFLFDYDHDGYDELVVSYVMYDGADESDLGEQMAVFYDLEREMEDATFRLADGQVHTFTFSYQSGLGGMTTYTYHYRTASYVAAPVGDYDGDGIDDFAYRESGRLTVRSTDDGRFLALAPSDGRLIHTADMNGDGRREIGIYTTDGRVRLMRSVDASVEIEEDAQTVRRIDAPTDNTIEDQDFVSEVHEKGLPAANVALVLSALLALVVVTRRRRT